ncbi:hypothetical protein C8J57DRAFT_1237698 [Mycena rebaudengoi]|nr:hypothetical protein C8J57DRAFT_1237698 [Mycena rebaudengoi]
MPTCSGEPDTNLFDTPKLAAVAQDSEAPTSTSTDSDSTGSVPDLVPASDDDSDSSSATGNNVEIKPHLPSPKAAINGIMNPNTLMGRNDTSSSTNNGVYHAVGPFHRVNVGVQTMGPAPNSTWRGPAHLVNRAFRDAFGDRGIHPGFVQGGPTGFRRGGVPYQAPAPAPNVGPTGHPFNMDTLNALVLHLQRLERYLQTFIDNVDAHYFPGRF